MRTRLIHSLFVPLVVLLLLSVAQAQAQAPEGTARNETVKQINQLQDLAKGQKKDAPRSIRAAWKKLEKALRKLKFSRDDTISGADAVQKAVNGVSDALGDLAKGRRQDAALPPSIQAAWGNVEEALGKLKFSRDNTISGADAVQKELNGVLDALQDLAKGRSQDRRLRRSTKTAWGRVEKALGKLNFSPDNTVSGDDAVQKALRGVSYALGKLPQDGSDAFGKLPKNVKSINALSLASTRLNNVIDLAKQARVEAEARAEAARAAKRPWKPKKGTLGEVIDELGFTYDKKRDILVSKSDAWQKKWGYAWGMDMLSPTLNMIFDCEPLYFYYKDREWMIELWKGQYGLETGAEIGVYYRNIPRVFKIPIAIDLLPDPRVPMALFNCAGYNKHPLRGVTYVPPKTLKMEFTLYRKDKGKGPWQKLLERGPEDHWWLTGFKWGVFSQPEHLKMDVRITLPDNEMRDAFRGALSRRGYKNGVVVSGKTVSFTFEHPHIRQPIPRKVQRRRKQGANQALVNVYNALKTKAKLKSNDPNAMPKSSEIYDAVAPFLWLFKKFKKVVQ